MTNGTEFDPSTPIVHDDTPRSAQDFNEMLFDNAEISEDETAGDLTDEPVEEEDLKNLDDILTEDDVEEDFGDDDDDDDDDELDLWDEIEDEEGEEDDEF
jgi:hypothetical protein